MQFLNALITTEVSATWPYRPVSHTNTLLDLVALFLGSLFLLPRVSQNLDRSLFLAQTFASRCLFSSFTASSIQETAPCAPATPTVSPAPRKLRLPLCWAPLHNVRGLPVFAWVGMRQAQGLVVQRCALLRSGRCSASSGPYSASIGPCSAPGTWSTSAST